MKNISINRVRKNIIQAIKEKYDMSVHEFSKTTYPKQWGINPSTLSSILSTGNSSFRTFEVLYQKLGLGVLSKKMVTTRELFIFVKTKTETNGKEKHQIPNRESKRKAISSAY